MIFTGTKDIRSFLEDGNEGAVPSLNDNIITVNTLYATNAPTIKTFWDFDLPESFVEEEIPAIYTMIQESDVEPAFQSQRKFEAFLEIGCFVDSFDAQVWREHSAIIAEALARSLDTVRGSEGFVEYNPQNYRFALAGWRAPYDNKTGETMPVWGGFICSARLLKVVNL